MKRTEAIALLIKHGNLRVPCSRYGSDSLECASVAYRACKNLEYHNGDEITPEALDHMMGLVVNDHDDVDYILKEYRIPRNTKAKRRREARADRAYYRALLDDHPNSINMGDDYY